MIEVLAPGSRLNSAVVNLMVYIPHFVVDMKHKAVVVVGYLSADSRMAFYATAILNL
jgi:hypothetical protein